MTRRAFLRSLSAGLACTTAELVLAGCAGIGGVARPAKVPHIGYLDDAPAPASLIDQPFSRGLRELGYVEGQNIVVDYRFAGNDAQRVQLLAGELVGAGVAVLVVVGSPSLDAATRTTKTIPIVNVVGTLEALGVDSQNHPGGNVTGIVSAPVSLSGKRLQLFKEAVPSLTILGVPHDPTNRNSTAGLDATQQAAAALGLRLVPAEVRGEADLAGAFQAFAQQHADGLFFPLNNLSDFTEGMASLTAKNRLPSMAGWKGWTDRGGLMIYGANSNEARQHAAVFVDKILKGAKPGDLPIEGPTKFDFVINLKAASTLGLTIPPAVLAQATEVIQ